MMNRWILQVLSPLLLLAAVPSSTTYQLNDFGVGSGGTAGTTSTTYKAEGFTGGLSGSASTSTTYQNNSGFINTEQANTPTAPTVDNGGGLYYNQLHVVINTANNPTDTIYLVAESTDNFATTNYVRSDDTLTSSIGSAAYQNYASWGSGGGFTVIGLLPNTTYKFKVKAMQGIYTETGFGPSGSATTVDLSFSYSLSPSTVDIGNLAAGAVGTSPSVTMNIDTNAVNGASVWVSGINAGLKSTNANFTISAVTGDLASLNTGFGIQDTSATQSSGGPLTKVSPYNGSSNNVGIVNSTFRTIFTSAGPITSGVGTLVGQAKSTSVTPAATDYKEILTMVGAASF